MWLPLRGCGVAPFLLVQEAIVRFSQALALFPEDDVLLQSTELYYQQGGRDADAAALRRQRAVLASGRGHGRGDDNQARRRYAVVIVSKPGSDKYGNPATRTGCHPPPLQCVSP